jgi:hypothetical protein
VGNGALAIGPKLPRPSSTLPRDLMQPFPAEPMRMWPSSTRVNKPENDDPRSLSRSSCLLRKSGDANAHSFWYGMGKARGHVSVIEGHAVCDGLSKLLRILAARGG